jgi:hypothetical protein
MLRPHPFAAAAALLLGAFSIPACSNSSGTTTTGGSSADLCSALSGYVTRCNVTDACQLAESKDCATAASSYSAGTLAATSACINAIPCGDAGSSPNTCFQTVVSNGTSPVTPTAAQAKLAQDYCATCAASNGGQTVADCVATFYTTTIGDSGVAVGAGPGSGLQTLNDSVATSVDTKCVPALGDGGIVACAATFRVCEGETYLAALPAPPAACSGGVTIGDGG